MGPVFKCPDLNDEGKIFPDPAPEHDIWLDGSEFL